MTTTTSSSDNLPVAAPLVQLGTLQASTPQALVAGATAISETLACLIRQKKLATNIQGKEYVRVEGWTVLGALLGVIAREESVVEREDGSYLATVSLVRMADDTVLSRASAECGMDEPRWANSPKYARRSMALTRATGKASRLAFSWIMTLAGFEPTPAEEMPRDTYRGKRPSNDALDMVPNSDGVPIDPEFIQEGKHRGKKWEEASSKFLTDTIQKERGSLEHRVFCQKELDRRAKMFSGAISDGDIPYGPEEVPASAK